MNSVVKRYVIYKNNLHQFFDHFQKLIDSRRYEELKADFRASISTPALSFPAQLLKHASSIYTPEVFKLFQNELCKAHDSSLLICSEVGTVTDYHVTPYEKTNHHVVKYDSLDGTIYCSRKKFEFCGILCSHALKVLTTRNIVKIPLPYILKRWTKNAKVGGMQSPNLSDSTSTVDPKAMLSMRYRDLCKYYNQLVTRAAETEETYEMVKDGLIKMFEKVSEKLHSKNLTFEGSSARMNDWKEKDPVIDEKVGIKVKGIKTKKKIISGKRLKSGLERTSRKRKSCGRNAAAATVVLTPEVPARVQHVHAPNVSEDGLNIWEPNSQHILYSTQLSQTGSGDISLAQAISPEQVTFVQPLGLHNTPVSAPNQMKQFTHFNFLEELQDSTSLTGLLQLEAGHKFNGPSVNDFTHLNAISCQSSASLSVCNEICSCPVPCPGGFVCRCRVDGKSDNF